MEDEIKKEENQTSDNFPENKEPNSFPENKEQSSQSLPPNKKPNQNNQLTDFLDKIPKHNWAIATYLLAIISVLLLVTSGGITGKAISNNQIESQIEDFVTNQMMQGMDADANIESITETSGLYVVSTNIGGDIVPLYFTQDGSYITQGRELMPTDTDSLNNLEQNTETNENSEAEVDWSIFENKLPDNVKEQILNSETEKPTPTDNERVVEFESYQKCENNLIIFYHPECSWCTEYFPVLEQMQQENPDMNIYALLLSENSEIANKYGVTGTPASIIDCKYFASGYMDKPTLENVLEEFR